MARRVKGAAVHARTLCADQSFGAREHLLRGATREGQEENALGSDTAADEMRHAMDERSRFSSARAGDDE